MGVYGNSLTADTSLLWMLKELQLLLMGLLNSSVPAESSTAGSIIRFCVLLPINSEECFIILMLLGFLLLLLLCLRNLDILYKLL